MRLCTGPVWMSADFFCFSGSSSVAARQVIGRIGRRLMPPIATYCRLPRATSSPAPGGSRRVIGIDANEHSPTTRNAGQKSDHTIA